jgi:phospholipase/carboxylesterase
MEVNNNQYRATGTPIALAKSALIMIHGRSASAAGMLPLAAELQLPEHTAVLAPQAVGNTWYPASFIAPLEVNQPSLDLGLASIHRLVEELTAAGIRKSNIYFLGFSQGACLTLEYISRNAERYAGVVAFTGGLIGEVLEQTNYKGDFAQTPILISTSNPDHHVPLRRVKDSGCLLERMNAKITVVAYPGKPHNITDEEIGLANKVIFAPKE